MTEPRSSNHQRPLADSLTSGGSGTEMVREASASRRTTHGRRYIEELEGRGQRKELEGRERRDFKNPPFFRFDKYYFYIKKKIIHFFIYC